MKKKNDDGVTVITDRPQSGRGDVYVRVLEGQALPPRGTVPGDARDEPS